VKVGITGHQRLDDPTDWNWVEQELSNVLEQLAPPLVGITSLAIGADQLFARAVLDHAGALEVVVPFDGYERTFTDKAAKREFDRLLRGASKVDILKKSGTDEEAYLAAGKLLVDRSDTVIAVWNGKPASGLGGTADIVLYAREHGKNVVHLNPTDHRTTRYETQS
jgi:hypothetical protein